MSQSKFYEKAACDDRFRVVNLEDDVELVEKMLDFYMCKTMKMATVPWTILSLSKGGI